jgi:ABC-type multidrug transport system fused ATPase/permease subunit
MDNGRVVAQGSHEELLADNEMYREIYETQSAEIRA